MTTQSETLSVLRVAELNERKANRFELTLTDVQCDTISQELGLLSLKKTRFKGQLVAKGRQDWQLTADLGATVQQSCVVTLKPVSTRIDTVVKRRFVPEEDIHQIDDEETAEVEINPDESLDPLLNEIDLMAIFVESLALELPTYPKVDGASLETTAFTEPGKAALSDDDVKPFAGLAALRDKMQKDD